MKITKKDLDKKKAEAEQRRSSIEAILQSLEKEASQLEEETLTAAANGHEAVYLSKSDALQLVKAKIKMRKEQLAHLEEPFTQEEVTAAWHAFVEDYNKEFEAIQKDIEKAKSALHNSNTALIDKQDEALKTRLYFVDLMGLEPEQKTASGIQNILPMKLIDNSLRGENFGGMRNAEEIYLMSVGLEPKSQLFGIPVEFTKAYKVIVMNEPSHD